MVDYPKDELAERAVLGSLMIAPKELFPIAFSHSLEEEDFFFREHRELYRVVRELYLEYEDQWDDVVLFERIQKHGINLSREYVLRIADEGNAQEVLFVSALKLIKELSIKRKLIDRVMTIFKDYEKKEIQDLAREVNLTLDLLVKEEKGEEVISSEAVEETIRRIKLRAHSEKVITGLPTGFMELDLLTLGFHEGNYVVIGARPSMGKTSFMLCNALAQAEQGHSGLIFSLEMPAISLFERMLAILSGVELSKIRSGFLNVEELHRIEKAGEKIKDLELFIVDKPTLSVYELIVLARQEKRKRDIKAIYVDYLQLLSASRRQNRYEEVSEVSRMLKGLARDLKVPVIALAQLSRQVEERSDKRPQLADLRESGQIEQDADLIIFIHRPEYYKKSPPPEEQGIAELIVAKQRQGPTGIIKLQFDKATTAFREMREEAQLEEEHKMNSDDMDLEIDF